MRSGARPPSLTLPGGRVREGGRAHPPPPAAPGRDAVPSPLDRRPPPGSPALKTRAAQMNHLHYGDNLRVLRESVDDASIDLIYLDPPFNSNASYNVLFKGPGGSGACGAIGKS